VGVDTERGAVVNDELPERIRSAGDDFSPDRDRMWSRVSEGMREPRGAAAPVARTRWRMPLVALATGAVVVIIGGIVLLGQMIGLGPEAAPSDEPPAAGPGTRSAEASESASDPGSSDAGEPSSADVSDNETDAETDEPPQGPQWLTTDVGLEPNSNDQWTQVTLKFTNHEALTALEVELRVAIGDGIVSLESWTTDDNLFEDAVETEEDGFKVYRWTLKDGVDLPTGSYTLAAQFTHDQGPRSADADDWRFEAATDDEDGEVAGGLT
jgi:hypothetical protein